MQLYSFKARSLADALRLVRQELGPEASVLHTREVGSPLARWLGGAAIEVTASAELAAPRFVETATGGRGSCRAAAAVPSADLEDFRRKFRQDLFVFGDEEPSLVEQLATQHSAGPTGRHGRFALLAQRLRRAGASPARIDRWLDRLAAELACDPECHHDRMHQRLVQIVAGDLPARGPLRLGGQHQNIVALIGPTGVGKTTTLAKLAAHFHLTERRSVGLVTLDTYRVAAIEQLRSYAQIMDLPIEVASNPLEMTLAIQRLVDSDLILIDTAGCSPFDEARLAELRTILAAAGPQEVLLVQSAPSDGAATAAAARAFAAAGASGLILTKLDEAWQIGLLPDWLAACSLPLCYVTTGQNVPHDIEPASAARLAQRIVGGVDGVSGKW